jgi:hypothetical protein
MDIREHHKRFMEIIEKYGLSEEKKADEIARFLSSGSRMLSVAEFAKLFGMTEEEAKIFLSFIEKGMAFRKHASGD